MDSDERIVIYVALGILLLFGMCLATYYACKKMNYENFQTTISNLSDEQKCMHICAFNYPGGYYDQYKFCIEKCDRISERACSS